MARQTETRSLRVNLSDEEVAARATQLAGDHIALTRAEDDLEAMKEAQKAAIKARGAEVERMRGDVSAQARAVAYRFVTTQVVCDWHFVLGDAEAGFKVLVRRDTGEAVERRPLTNAERQLSIGDELSAASAEDVARWKRELDAAGAAAPVEAGHDDNVDETEKDEEE